jgi:hypothetical protein
MHEIPPPPDVPDEQRAAGDVSLRYEDISQDGRVMLLAMPQAIGEVWRCVLDDRGVAIALRDAGVVPILTRLLIEGAGGPISVRKRLRAEGRYHVVHTTDAAGVPDRILLEMWASVAGPKSRTHGPPPPGAGEMIPAGRVFASHVFTRPFAPPGQRKVTRLDGIPGVDPLPPDRTVFVPLESCAEIPAGAKLLDEAPVLDPVPLVFGLAHTDSNQHVNSLVYPRAFEDAAIRRAAALGRSTGDLLSRRVELGYRKPCFAGEQMRIALRLFELEGRLGAAGTFVPASDPAGKPHTYASLIFG